MGVLDLFRSLNRDPRFTEPRPDGVTGLPWQTPTDRLTRIVVDDIFGNMVDVVDRGNALRVPAVARARALLVGSIADLPLVAYRGDERVAEQPTFLYRTEDVSLWHRMAQTIDDLLFYDESLWLRENDADGRPIDAQRVPIDGWSVDDQGRILIGEQPVAKDQVIYFPGPGAGGLIAAAGDTIRGARSIERAWVARTASPIPPTLFRQVEAGTVTEDEVDALLDGWTGARKNPETAGVGFVPYGVEPVFPTMGDDSQMFIEGRNAVRLDIANHTNIPASLLDGSTATASLTYTTAEGQRSSFHEQTIRYWTAPIEHRLSMDDIVPRGQRVRFDITYLTQQPPTGEPGED